MRDIYVGYDNFDDENKTIIIPNGFNSKTLDLYLDVTKDSRIDDCFTFFYYGVKEHPNIKRMSISNIPLDKQYIYIIQLLSKLRFREIYNSDIIEIPDNIVQDIKNGRCSLVFEYVTEGLMISDVVMSVCNKYSIPFSSVYYMNSDFKQNYDLPFHHFGVSLWDRHNPPLSEEERVSITESIENKETRTNKISCLNRRGKDFRAYLAYSLMNIVNNKDSVFTLSDQAKYIDCNNNKYITINDNTKYQQFLESLPWEYDVQNLSEFNPTYINKELHRDTYIHIVTETFFSENCIFFSEKIFKPIIMMQPFILVSTPGSLEKLRDCGYETFPEVFDESYDEIEDDKTRLDFIIDEIKTVYTYSKEKLSDILYDSLPKLIHNSKMHENNRNDNKLYEILNKEIYNEI